ncbi:hypothetical protein PPL_08513 [Heterostelium album PN500]|uniref:Uncharacterized protein n=1 Tax=Heterostelium pallidum (strain ATCC 26659 / Pp 5 / PN500) TaxID=670386 RepID=D3BIE3_HETP5|nr:hypothetical protein PPL_08513 [Heterostelium album PN500]EFA79043.1 hypothetical protein PPL_08513 [Heterostelium album PN500]|eukprot:XP_020431166.1 hypothetical protein PPL_08513 [Heterostelium album PN500]
METVNQDEVVVAVPVTSEENLEVNGADSLPQNELDTNPEKQEEPSETTNPEQQQKEETTTNEVANQTEESVNNTDAPAVLAENNDSPVDQEEEEEEEGENQKKDNQPQTKQEEQPSLTSEPSSKLEDPLFKKHGEPTTTVNPEPSEQAIDECHTSKRAIEEETQEKEDSHINVKRRTTVTDSVAIAL